MTGKQISPESIWVVSNTNMWITFPLFRIMESSNHKEVIPSETIRSKCNHCNEVSGRRMLQYIRNQWTQVMLQETVHLSWRIWQVLFPRYRLSMDRRQQNVLEPLAVYRISALHWPTGRCLFDRCHIYSHLLSVKAVFMRILAKDEDKNILSITHLMLI